MPSQAKNYGINYFLEVPYCSWEITLDLFKLTKENPEPIEASVKVVNSAAKFTNIEQN